MPALLETFASYVPVLIRQRIAARPASLTAPESARFDGAVLFADISGFTALAGRLAESGPEGIEELTRVLNDYFGQLIALIAEHGGDVVKFAGDALLAVWPAAAPDDLRARTLSAAYCALVAQKELRDYVAGGEPLALRMAVGAGQASIVHIGGAFGRWEFFIAGEPIVQVSLAGRAAAPGDVVLSPEAWALAGDDCSGAPLDSGAVRLDAVPAPPPLAALPPVALDAAAEPALRAYIPGAILARLLAGQDAASAEGDTLAGGWLAELRRVTVLFINLPDLTHRQPLEAAQAIMRTLQTALYRYEGSVNKLSVDDKGVTLVAALGLPPLAHEDDATRATLAALEIAARLGEQSLRCAIGLATGQAVCGGIGNALRREYTMIGDVVNLAARLMQAAGDGILCSASTAQAAQARIAFDERPAVQVKGKAEPVAVYRPAGEKRLAVRTFSEIVGRTAERAALGAGIQNLLRGSAGVNVFIIEGEAGIGKSRLIEDLRRQADALGVTTLAGMGDAIEKSTPYHGWRHIVTQALGLNLLDDPERCRRHVRLALGPRLLRQAPLLNAVLPLDFPENESTAALTGPARAEQTRQLLVEILQASIARSPKVLVIEDAHWLDSASWAVVLAVSRQVRPLMLAIATRPLGEPPAPEYEALLQAGNVQRLKLDSLAPDDAVGLVCQRLGVAALPEPVANLIRERAEGNPFFSEELAYALRDSGLILVENGTCRLAPEAGDLRRVRFPDTVEGVIISRIDRLSPSHQMALKVASVIGRVFAFRALLEVHPIESDRPHLPDYVRVLEKLDLTPLESPEPDLAYIFKHIITQEVAYNLMLFAQRRELHRAVAEWYERNYSYELPAHAPLLAHHWNRAEDWNRTRHYALLAGDAAAQLYANAEARLHYTLALGALARLGDTPGNRRLRAETAVKRVIAGWGADSPEAMLELLGPVEEQLKELAGPDGQPAREDRLRLARVHYWMGRAEYLRNAPREAIGYYRQVLGVAQELGDEELLAVPSSFIGQVMMVQGHFGKSLPLLAQAIGAFERAGNWGEWMRCVGFHGAALVATGDTARGVAEGQRAVARARTLRSLSGVAMAQIYLAATYMLAGDAAEMRAAAGAVIAAAEQTGDRLFAYLGYGLCAWAEGLLGEVTAAEAHMAQSQSLGRMLGGRLILVDWLDAAAALIALRAGRAADACALAGQVVAAAQASGGIFAEGYARRVWGQARLALDPADAEAERDFAESVRLLTLGDARPEAARTHAVWADLCRARGDEAGAALHAGQAQLTFA